MEKKAYMLDDDALENVTGGREVNGHTILKFGNLSIGMQVGLLSTHDFVNYYENGDGRVVQMTAVSAHIEMYSGTHQGSAIQVTTNCGKAGQSCLFYAI